MCVCVCHQGEVLMSIEIMPKAVADLRKAGLGRSEPNMNPYLPPPTGRMKFVRHTVAAPAQLCTGGGPVRVSVCLLCFACVWPARMDGGCG